MLIKHINTIITIDKIVTIFLWAYFIEINNIPNATIGASIGRINDDITSMEYNSL
jgi:hypothetical protein